MNVRHIGFLVLVYSATAGCGPSNEVDPPQQSNTFPPWTNQVAAVRSGAIHVILVDEETIGPTKWSQLSEDCAELRILHIEQLDVPSAEFALLAELPEIERIYIGSPVDDERTKHIAAAASLKVVNLPHGQFSNEGLQNLTTLPELELLRFSSPNVTDAGMQHIAGIETLRFLHLIDVPITDAGIRHLHSMTELESFYLDGGDCSEEALGDLLRALPQLHFHRDQLHLPGDPLADDHASP